MLRGAKALLIPVMLASAPGVAVGQGHGEELVVMPYACSAVRGKPILTPADNMGHRILGRRQSVTHNACASGDPDRCRRFTTFRFEMDCAGSPVAWVEVVAALTDRRRARLEGGTLYVRAPAALGLSSDDPCAAPHRNWRPGIYRYCAERRAREQASVIAMPPGYAPLLGIDAVFVPAPALTPVARLAGPAPGAAMAHSTAQPSGTPAGQLAGQPAGSTAHASTAPAVRKDRVAQAQPAAQAAPASAPIPSTHPRVASLEPPPPVAVNPKPQPPASNLSNPEATAAGPSSPAPPGQSDLSLPNPSQSGSSQPSVVARLLNAPLDQSAADRAAQAPPRLVPVPELGRALLNPIPADPAAPGSPVPDPASQLREAPRSVANPANTAQTGTAPPAPSPAQQSSPVSQYGVIAISTLLGLAGLAMVLAARRNSTPAAAPLDRDLGAIRMTSPGPSAGAGMGLPVISSANVEAGDVPTDENEAMQVLGLGVGPDADLVAIKKLVDALRFNWHPDRANDATDRQMRERRLQQINAAWEILSKTARKRPAA